MLMAIHRCSKSETWSWMDETITPTPRRDALLRQLSGPPDLQPRLSDADREWVSSNLKWTQDADKRIREAFTYSG